MTATGERRATERALADTVANLADKEIAMLRTLSDIDDGAAWRRHQRKRIANDRRRR